MSEQVKSKCPRCYREQSDWLLCSSQQRDGRMSCTERMVADLTRIPDLYADLQDTITGQVKMGEGGKSNERPLPYREKAVKAGAYVKNQLTTEVRDLDMGDMGDVADNVASCAAWLAERVERIRSAVNAEEIADQFDYCIKIMLPLVDRPADREFVGKCVVCESDLYAKHGDGEGTCQKCKLSGVTTTFDPVARRDEILGQVEQHLATVAECAVVLGLFGLPLSVDTIQNWARERQPRFDGDIRHSARLYARGRNTAGHALYLVADVMDLAKERVAQGKRRAS